MLEQAAAQVQAESEAILGRLTPLTEANDHVELECDAAGRLTRITVLEQDSVQDLNAAVADTWAKLTASLAARNREAAKDFDLPIPDDVLDASRREEGAR